MARNGLLLIGCGKMGGAMLAGWIAEGTSPTDVVVVEPGAENAAAAAAHGVTVVSAAAEISDNFRPGVAIVAVKPQQMADVVPEYQKAIDRECVVLSIAAGTTISFFEDIFGAEQPIVRSMPNTPAAVGKGMLVGCPNGNVSEDMRSSCTRLLAAVGAVAWVDDEGQMDAVTAVSGSGPAYVFYMIECMAEAGRKLGLPEELAVQLAEQTVFGAGALAHDSDEAASQLRINVTSPGGTTAAALAELMADDGLQPLIDRAIKAANDRSVELGG